MSKAKSQFVCSTCGATHMKWMGKCTECGEWNTLEEVTIALPEKGRSVMPISASSARPVPLPQIALDGLSRLPLAMSELNRVPVSYTHLTLPTNREV